MDCYDIEWQNVNLGETCPTTFETTELKEVSQGHFLMLITFC